MITNYPRAGRLGSAPRQARSEEALGKIAEAVISILAAEGPGALTHRRVAQVANVSLASTTYYYENKFAMIADATGRLLKEYVQSFIGVTARHRDRGTVVFDLPSLILKLLINAAGQHGTKTLAWCEIMLDCARSEDGHALARQWLQQMDEAWTALVSEFGTGNPSEVAGPAIDTVMGLLFLTKSLDLSAVQILLLFRDHRPLEEVVGTPSFQNGFAISESSTTAKQTGTRRRIVNSAVELLIAGETSPLSYSAVAKRSGITSAAVAYHFKTVDALLEATERTLFANSLACYVEALSSVSEHELEHYSITDLANAIFVREVTQNGPLHLASLSVWLQASRKAVLRPLIASMALEMVHQWARWLRVAGTPSRSDYPLFAFGLFVGKSIRALSTGVATRDLAGARGDFHRMFNGFSEANCPFAR